MKLREKIKKDLLDHHEFCDCKVCKGDEWLESTINDILTTIRTYLVEKKPLECPICHKENDVQGFYCDHGQAGIESYQQVIEKELQ